MKAKVVLLILLAVIFVLTTLIQKSNKTSQTIISKAAAPSSIITPIQIKETSIMDSPDGTKTLTLNSNSLFVSSTSDGVKKEIFKSDSNDLHNFEIPYNSWSPDNVYIFLKDKVTTPSNYLVFQSSGNLFANNLQYLNIQDLFQKKIQNYSIEDVTGWADPNLVIVNAKQNETGSKVSFWFDVPSQSFIKLNTYFK